MYSSLSISSLLIGGVSLCYILDASYKFESVSRDRYIDVTSLFSDPTYSNRPFNILVADALSFSSIKTSTV